MPPFHHEAFIPRSSRWLARRGDPRGGPRAEAGVGPITPHRPGHRHQSLHLPVVGLPWQAYVRFVGWLPVGIVIYLLYSHSGLRHHYPDALDLPEIEPDADAPEIQAPGAR
jgi:hypothetical protein